MFTIDKQLPRSSLTLPCMSRARYCVSQANAIALQALLCLYVDATVTLRALGKSGRQGSRDRRIRQVSRPRQGVILTWSLFPKTNSWLMLLCICCRNYRVFLFAHGQSVHQLVNYAVHQCPEVALHDMKATWAFTKPACLNKVLLISHSMLSMGCTSCKQLIWRTDIPLSPVTRDDVLAYQTEFPNT
jgi:hypothetical protein